MKTCFTGLSTVLLLTSLTAFSAEKYKAAIGDGTPTNIQSNTRVNDDGNEPDEELANQDTGEIPEPAAPATEETAPVVVKKQVAAPKPIQKAQATTPVEAPQVTAAPVCLQVVPAQVAPATTPKPTKKYDVVPDSRISEMAERLKYVNDILKRFGFAFDYRSTTLNELKSAIAQLENAESKKKSNN